jgi:hypothetical protein
MTNVTLIGWRPGIQTVSLILAVKEQVGSLKAAKALVESLIDGQEITIQFDDTKVAVQFCTSAEQLGAVVRH